jgi:hypothetical protein
MGRFDLHDELFDGVEQSLIDVAENTFHESLPTFDKRVLVDGGYIRPNSLGLGGYVLTERGKWTYINLKIASESKP